MATIGTPEQQILLRETLSLIVSYAWDQKVDLEPTALGERSPDHEQSFPNFIREFRLRHAIAAASFLPQILQEIEINPSHESRLERSDSLGSISGRLDIQRYLARRVTFRTGPRRYPIIQSRWFYDTPENVLTRMALNETHVAMRDNPFPKKSAESIAATRLLHWSTNRLVRRPWDEVLSTGLRERLYNEVQARVRRRQTGNDAAYKKLLSWFDEWTINLDRLGAEQVDSVIGGLFDFPVGEQFWDKVFEVWCLLCVNSAIESLGWNQIEGPAPLHQKSGPIFRYLSSGGQQVSLYFQKQVMHTTARWNYRNGRPLRGIPDIMLVKSSGGSPLIIDAKHRFTSTLSGFTRSEETYKMLGYAENFHPSSAQPRFRGILIFPTNNSSSRILDGPTEGRIDLIAMNLAGDRTVGTVALANAVKDWEAGAAPCFANN